MESPQHDVKIDIDVCKLPVKSLTLDAFCYLLSHAPSVAHVEKIRDLIVIYTKDNEMVFNLKFSITYIQTIPLLSKLVKVPATPLLVSKITFLFGILLDHGERPIFDHPFYDALAQVFIEVTIPTFSVTNENQKNFEKLELFFSRQRESNIKPPMVLSLEASDCLTNLFLENYSDESTRYGPHSISEEELGKLCLIQKTWLNHVNYVAIYKSLRSAPEELIKQKYKFLSFVAWITNPEDFILIYPEPVDTPLFLVPICLLLNLNA
jgi:hypothetical protein